MQTMRISDQVIEQARPAPVLSRTGPPVKRRRACIVSPSRGLISSLEFIAKVHYVTRSVFESADLIAIQGIDRTLKDCGLLILDMSSRGKLTSRNFLRNLVHSGRSEGIEIVALTDSPLHCSYPGVTEVRKTTSAHQLNVREFDRIFARWRHPDARTEILPAYRELLNRAHQIDFSIEGVHHYWRKLAILDGDYLFCDVVRSVCDQMGLKCITYQRSIDLARDALSGTGFSHVIIDQAFEFGFADDLDPCNLLAALERKVEKRTEDLKKRNIALEEAMEAAKAASIAKSEETGAVDLVPIVDLARQVGASPKAVTRTLRSISFYSIHDQITRILPPIPHIKEIDRMYHSNPLLLSVGAVARKLDPKVNITTTGALPRIEDIAMWSVPQTATRIHA